MFMIRQLVPVDLMNTCRFVVRTVTDLNSVSWLVTVGKLWSWGRWAVGNGTSGIFTIFGHWVDKSNVGRFENRSRLGQGFQGKALEFTKHVVVGFEVDIAGGSQQGRVHVVRGVW